MYLTTLALHQFRNFSAKKISFDSGFNVIAGDNGSGKTSILEAAHYLSTGRSFRSAQARRVIQHTQNDFQLYGHLNVGELTHQIGMQRSKTQDGLCKLNGEKIASHVAITRFFPVQLIHPESFLFFTAGARYRAKLMDWGAFYSQPAFHKNWSQVKQLIKQRNASLKQQHSRQMVEIWERELIAKSCVLDQQRQAYMEQLIPIVYQLLPALFVELDISIKYHRGWPQDKTLAEVFAQHFPLEQRTGTTQYGPHRADIKIKANGHPAHEVLSRGQQKMLICALKLAQGIQFNRQQGYPCVYLVDDICSELDGQHLAIFLQHLAALHAQVILTTLQPDKIAHSIESQVNMQAL